MNAETTTDLTRNAALASGTGDDRMDQVRDLLFGEFARHNNARLLALEARQRDLEAIVAARLDALHARLDAFGAQLDASQRSAFEELSLGLGELADRVRHMSKT